MAQVRVFVDTSALYAILDEDDFAHPRAAATWGSLLGTVDLVTSNYVEVEATELLRRRLGRDAVVRLVDGLLPSIERIWVDEGMHAAAREAYRERAWTISMVDQTSFVLMRRLGVDVAFAYDGDFESAGFGLAAPPAEPEGRRLSEVPAASGDRLPSAGDLVGVAEIAARSGHPTSTVQSWRRRHQTFPAPAASLASGPVWEWPSVDAWIGAERRAPRPSSAGLSE